MNLTATVRVATLPRFSAQAAVRSFRTRRKTHRHRYPRHPRTLHHVMARQVGATAAEEVQVASTMMMMTIQGQVVLRPQVEVEMTAAAANTMTPVKQAHAVGVNTVVPEATKATLLVATKATLLVVVMVVGAMMGRAGTVRVAIGRNEISANGQIANGKSLSTKWIARTTATQEAVILTQKCTILLLRQTPRSTMVSFEK